MPLNIRSETVNQLNLADCFAYATAKNHRTALLFSGDDFSKTVNRPLRHRQGI